MDLMKIRKFIYRTLVDSHPLVSRDYAYYQDMDQSSVSYCKKMLKILQLNWKYRICRNELDKSLDRMIMPEGRAQELPAAGELAERLSWYDVVSFDIFDTLIFRAVEKPADVFRLLEGKWKHTGFAGQREAAERKARLKKQEVSIEDIYEILSRELSIDKEAGIACELEMEAKVCYANPYMHEVYRRLMENGKTLIAVSDMYIPHDQMKRLLAGCGYGGFSRIFVSCDYGAGKGSGELQGIVRQEMGAQLTYIHAGDNMRSDIQGSRQAGWDTFYYPNIQKSGSPYRPKEMVSLAAAFYKGLANGRLHSGAPCGDGHYQYGYAYGGIMAAGYCQYLDGLARREGIDQFLFVARDGYILNKIYRRYFHNVDSAYVPFSRFASYQITMERSWRNFLQNVVSARARVSPREKLSDAMRICGIGFLEKYLDRYCLAPGMEFNEKTCRRVEQVFEENMEEILPYYAEGESAAGEYFAGIIGEHKKICVADIGWTGTSVTSLHYFLKEKCGMDIEVCGALMGMSSSVSAGIGFDTKLMHSYMFSTGKNHENLMRHTGKQNEIDFRNLLAEILFTEDAPTFLKFSRDGNGKVKLVYGPPENNGEAVKEMQKGICDFCRDFYAYSEKFPGWLEIGGQEAYLPLDRLAGAKKYCMKFLGDYEVHEGSGFFADHNVRKFREIAGG